MPRTRLVWSAKAKENLRQIQRYIGRDSPEAARALIKQFKVAARRLKDFPEIGAVVEEKDDPEIREILVGSYRIIYRYRRPLVAIIEVRHGARLLREEEFEE